MSDDQTESSGVTIVRQGLIEDLDAAAVILSSNADDLERLIGESDQSLRIEQHDGKGREPTRLINLVHNDLRIHWTNGRRRDETNSPDDLNPTLQIQNRKHLELRVRLPIGSAPSRMALDVPSLVGMMRDMSGLCTRSIEEPVAGADPIIGSTAAAHVREHLDETFKTLQLSLPTPWSDARISNPMSLRPPCDHEEPFEAWRHFESRLPTMITVTGAMNDEAHILTVSMSPILFNLRKEGSAIDAMRLIAAWEDRPITSRGGFPRNGVEAIMGGD